MSLFRHLIASTLDKHAPVVSARARYFWHVEVKGRVVYPDLTKRLFRAIDSKHAIAVDVGANVGLFCRYLSHHFATVHAFEPVPYLADRLSRTAPSNCVIHPAAAGSLDGPLTLRIPVDANGRHMHALTTAAETNSLGLFKANAVEEIQSRACKLDTALKGLKKIAFVKIDVEGFEGAVIQGATEILQQHRPLILMEIGRAHNPNYQSVIDKLYGLGYQWFAPSNEGLKSASIDLIEAQPSSADALVGADPDDFQWDFLFVPSEMIELTKGLVI